MIVLDATIVNVALPSIKDDLGFSASSLAWVANAYLLTFGGFMLLGGRLGDLFGARRVFLIGLVLFTLASLACGLASSQASLVAARAVQGVGGAIVAAIALALLMKLFTEPGERAKAMGVFGFVVSGGGTLGVLLGGVLTDAFAWNWIFLVNLPIGIAVFIGCRCGCCRRTSPVEERGGMDVAGAVTVTGALMLAGLRDRERAGRRLDLASDARPARRRGRAARRLRPDREPRLGAARARSSSSSTGRSRPRTASRR